MAYEAQILRRALQEVVDDTGNEKAEFALKLAAEIQQPAANVQQALSALRNANLYLQEALRINADEWSPDTDAEIYKAQQAILSATGSLV